MGEEYILSVLEQFAYSFLFFIHINVMNTEVGGGVGGMGRLMTLSFTSMGNFIADMRLQIISFVTLFVDMMLYQLK